MLMLLPIVFALATDPAPAPSSAPRPTPLTEIGRVRALPACVPIVAHANGAITQALDNDRTLAILSNNAHTIDFDRLNFLQRRNAVEALMRQAEAIRIASSSGDVEIKKLREYAENAADPQRKAELKAFADALGGALYRQKKAAVEFMRDVTVMRGREDAAEGKQLMAQSNQVPPGPQGAAVLATQPVLPGPPPDGNYNKQFKLIGDDIDADALAVHSDEGIAADHSIAATSGC
jgi:hypothetical protein